MIEKKVTMQMVKIVDPVEIFSVLRGVPVLLILFSTNLLI